MLKILTFAFAILFTFLIPKKSQAGEKSLYDFLWLDPDKKVYVLQNKLFKKERSVYFDIGYLANFTSKFQDTNGISGKVGYFVSEDWGIELFYNQYSNQDNDDWKNIRSISNTDPFVRRLNSAYGAMAIWSPFYGKINTFNRIFYFDWSFGLGVSKVAAESNAKTVSDENVNSQFADESLTALAWKTNLKFHLRENIHLSVDWLQQHYSAKGPNKPNGATGSDKLRMNQDLILSVGYSF